MNPNEQDNQQPQQQQTTNPAVANSNNEQYQATPPLNPAAQPPLPNEQQPAYGQPQPPSNMHTEDPGKVYSIVGIVMAFIPLMALVGLVLSIIGTMKSNKAHFSKTLGIVGIVLNGASMVLGILGFVFFALMTGAAYTGIQERAEQTAYQAYAFQVVQSAETTFAETGTYPADASTVLLDTEVEGIEVVNGQPMFEREIGYKKCSETGAQVYFLDTDASMVIRELGDASATTPC